MLPYVYAFEQMLIVGLYAIALVVFVGGAILITSWILLLWIFGFELVDEE